MGSWTRAAPLSLGDRGGESPTRRGSRGRGELGWKLGGQGQSPFPFPSLPVSRWIQRVDLEEEKAVMLSQLLLLLPAS